MKKFQSIQRKQRGFTLVEMGIAAFVVAGLLVAVFMVAPKFKTDRLLALGRQEVPLVVSALRAAFIGQSYRGADRPGSAGVRCVSWSLLRYNYPILRRAQGDKLAGVCVCQHDACSADGDTRRWRHCLLDNRSLLGHVHSHDANFSGSAGCGHGVRGSDFEYY